MPQNTGLIVYDSLSGGHRAAYLELFRNVLGAEHLCAPWRTVWWRLLRAPRVLFSTFEGNKPFALGLALLRSLMGKPTVAVFLQADRCFYPGFRPKLKYVFMRVMKYVPCISILPILPYSVFPRYREISRDFMYDPQLWDMAGQPAISPNTPLAQAVIKAAKGRPIVVALGTQNTDKGFDVFVRFAEVNQRNGAPLLLVAAGKVKPNNASDAACFTAAGGVLEDRMITDEELFSLYAVATYAWCCYAPHYDQASGIFGRAAQLGVPAIVREGSVVERFRAQHAITGVAVPYDDMAAAFKRVIKANLKPVAQPTFAEEWKAISLAALRRALKIQA